MDFSNALKQYWPFLLLALWFGYKWWSARQVAGLLPELKQRGATLVDVRSAGEYASGHAPGTVNIPLQELGSRLAEIPNEVFSLNRLWDLLIAEDRAHGLVHQGAWCDVGRPDCIPLAEGLLRG